MAEDLSGISKFPHFHNFTASSTLTEIKIPEACTKIFVGCNTQALWIVQNGGSDGGAVPTNKGFIPKTNYIELFIGIGLEAVQSIYVASQGGSGDVSVILQEQR